MKWLVALGLAFTFEIITSKMYFKKLNNIKMY